MTWTWYLYVMARSTRPGEDIAVPAAWGHVRAKTAPAAIEEALAALDLSLDVEDFEKFGTSMYEATFSGEGRGRAADKIAAAVRAARCFPTGFNMLTVQKGKLAHNGSPQVYR